MLRTDHPIFIFTIHWKVIEVHLRVTPTWMEFHGILSTAVLCCWGAYKCTQKKSLLFLRWFCYFKWLSLSVSLRHPKLNRKTPLFPQVNKPSNPSTQISHLFPQRGGRNRALQLAHLWVLTPPHGWRRMRTPPSRGVNSVSVFHGWLLLARSDLKLSTLILQ